jgi:SanA protein
MKTILKIILRLLLGSLSLTALTLLGLWLYIGAKYRAQIHAVGNAPSERIAIVFGAGIRRNGMPTPVLYDRVATAVELYHAGSIEKLLLSGDGLSNAEPLAMQQAALDLGVPEDALALDHAGLSTYDTCYRAKAIFGVTHALLVTQNFHLPRALFICDALGLQASGVSADRREYLRRSQTIWNIREVFATAAAWWDVNIVHPAPVLEEPLPSP